MTQLEILQNKILEPAKLENMLSLWRFQDKKIVFTNGCFDILHRGHIEYLSKAADLGDVLIVGLNTDSSVSRIKGPKRPVVDEQSRALLLAALHFSTAIVLFDESTPYDLIRKIQPDILVKGKDYKAEEVVGYDIVTAKGGKVETITLVDGFSTTGLIQKLIGDQ
ncbi:MAG: D-glycero-beta-D-manno-heptose 1-phosphate adenylyltransferase [Bacteroidales bacterium]|nr:D-glycero-beta-D-manno-heptose 1-phosphate adenylyltransferase [Bacteroidales bacterium]HOI31799.1 D-glycero-beta-D-manno-heptose 1-phosphate adenylyltransferase [Bacteroidales bacterium]